MTNTAKSRIIRDLQGNLLNDNHHTRRYFRGWLDGSYLGESHYHENIAAIKLFRNKPKAIRAFIIAEFCCFTAKDADCSTSYAQKVIVETLDKDTLEKLNLALAEDALDLIADWLKENEVAA
tara:strand:+ start:106 stop:471 length:366 start_codon:yes stop_codon:yes gene_type:complete